MRENIEYELKRILDKIVVVVVKRTTHLVVNGLETSSELYISTGFLEVEKNLRLDIFFEVT